jgi:predicted phage terminase large subunit-like protein
LFAALELPDVYPFIIPIADTGLQAAINIANIKTELDNNELIKQDYGNITGNFVEDWTLQSEEEWQAKNMLLSHGVRILARSRGQKIRGLRHREHRPKLVILDDPEDLEWVATKEKRDKTEKWLRGEVLPAVDETVGKVVVIGNRLHSDALIARLGRDPLFKRLSYPLVKDGEGTEFDRCTWKAKYPNQQAIENQKAKAGPVGWQREYQLKAVPDEGQEIIEADIHYYDQEPAETAAGLQATAFDLAISKKQTADSTAGVEGHTGIVDDHFKIYIQPYPLNAKFDMHELIEYMKAKQSAAGGIHLFYVEEVAYQKAAIEEMIRELLPVEAVKPIGDKRARLKIAAKYIKNGTVLFPRGGCEDLLIQLLGFGVEAHDDLVDALVYLILELVKQGGRSFEAVAL